MDKKIDLVCDRCGSRKLEFLADAVWIVEEQKFRYEVLEGAWCKNCDNFVPVKHIKI